MFFKTAIGTCGTDLTEKYVISKPEMASIDVFLSFIFLCFFIDAFRKGVKMHKNIYVYF